MFASFYVLTLAFLVGVTVRSVYAFDPYELLTVAVLTIALAALASLRKSTLALYVVLAGCAGLLGVVRTDAAFSAYVAAQQYKDGVRIDEVCLVVAEPDVRDTHAVLLLRLEQNERVRLRAKVPTYPSFTYGDRVSCAGDLHIAESFVTDTGREFDYPGYLRKDHIHYELRSAVLGTPESGHGNSVVAALLTLKQAWLDQVSRAIPEPEASLAGGVIVGAKRSLGETWLEAFRETGIIHIVVLSGYNLTLVANVITRWAGVLPRAFALLCGSLGVAAFAIMVGGGATVVRASIMAIIGLLAVHVRRPRMLVRMLVLAAIGMVLWNPFVLLFDSGFQLSFIATLGLVLGAPLLSRVLHFVPETLQFREIVAATLATQVAVLPLLMYHIGTVSLVAPIVNVLVLPVVPFMMLVGFMAGLAGLLAPGLGMPIAWIAYLMLAYTFVVVEVFASLPLASIEVPVVPAWMLLVAYAVLGIIMWRLYSRMHNTRTQGAGA